MFLCCLPPTLFVRRPQPMFESKCNLNKLIIHFHGGGFVSMSSGSHQNYTRFWANETKIPIFSVDYRLSPKYAFPAALNDCWQVYYYLVENAKKEFGINPEKIILVGDSAGGNLVAALTIMAITRGYRVPDGIFLAYPGNFTGSVTFLYFSSQFIQDRLYTIHASLPWRPYPAFSLH